MPLPEPPDFEGKKGMKWDGTINVPTLIYALVIIGGGVIAFANFQVERNDVKWEQREQRRDIDANKHEAESRADALSKSLDANVTAISAVNESVRQTNRTVDHLEQSIEFMQQREKKLP